MQLFAGYDGVLCRVFDFPFAFTKDLQPGGINHQMRDFHPRWNVLKLTLTDFARLLTLGVIPGSATGTSFISVKMESIKPVQPSGSA